MLYMPDIFLSFFVTWRKLLGLFYGEKFWNVLTKQFETELKIKETLGKKCNGIYNDYRSYKTQLGCC